MVDDYGNTVPLAALPRDWLALVVYFYYGCVLPADAHVTAYDNPY